MNQQLETMEPKEVLRYFREISDIPRESGKEEGITEYLIRFAKQRNLEVHRDEFLNVLIKKEASPGKENKPAVILQAHTDMVCEKNKDTDHDFSKDPLRLKVEGDKLAAEGTTLGADNGIGVALMLALLAEESVSHPALEVLFTSDEERGMTGAENFDTKLLAGEIFINLDGSDEGIFIVGCAGGPGVKTEIPIEREESPTGLIPVLLEIRGLKGGHSGEDIHRGRANAIKLAIRSFLKLRKAMKAPLISIQGGLKYNAIPREAEIQFLLAEDDIPKAEKILMEFQAALRKEYRPAEPVLSIHLRQLKEEDSFRGKAMKEDSAKRVLHYLYMAENGVLKMNTDFPELVETSVGMDVVRTEEEMVIVETLTRSSVESAYQDSYEKIISLANYVGGKTTIMSDCPEWDYNPDSPITSLLEEVYQEMTGKEPEKQILHAGLECGVFGKKAEQKLDMVALGPDIRDMHTPGEYVSLSSLERFWKFFKKAIEKI